MSDVDKVQKEIDKDMKTALDKLKDKTIKSFEIETVGSRHGLGQDTQFKLTFTDGTKALFYPGWKSIGRDRYEFQYFEIEVKE